MIEFIPFDDDGVLTPTDDRTLDSIVKGGLFTSALGHAPSDILLEGDGFVTPDTSYAPEEVLPGQMFDTLDIKVYTSPESGVPFISEKNHRGNGSTTTYSIGDFPGSLGSVTVAVDGVVKNLFFVTEGGVIRPGGTILDLVPTKDNLIVEARLPNSDIGFVSAGQKAVIKLSSSDSVNFGQIDAIVTQISPDSEKDENDERVVFYKILLKTESDFFESKNKIYRLTPGVKVVASINIGERTVANYLLSPFMGSLGQSFQER